MKVLLVFAHPEPRSFQGALRDAGVHALRAAGHEVAVSDLYAQGFDPRGGRADFLEPPAGRFVYQEEQVRACEWDLFAPELVAEMEKVRWADAVVLQFPVWWSSMPAILKGWIDRVFAMGFAYHRGHMHETGLLRGKRALVACTTGAPREMLGEHLDALLYPIQFGILDLVGFAVLPPFVACAPASVPDEVRDHYLTEYRERLLGLAHDEPLSFEHRARERPRDGATPALGAGWTPALDDGREVRAVEPEGSCG